MKTRPFGLYLFIAILAGIFLYGTVRLLKLRYEAGDLYPPYSSLRSDPLGTKALYEGIDRLDGFSCFRNYRPFTELTELRDSTIFYQGIAAWRFLYAADEEAVKAVEEIVENGGRLFVSFLPVGRESELMSHALGFEPAEEDESEGQKDEEEQVAEERSAEEIEEEQSFSIIERWGLELKVSELPESQDDDDLAPAPSARLFNPQTVSLPDSVSWHTALYFTPQDDAWRVLYRRETYPAIVERSYGEGTIVLSADSYFLSNEAMRNERRPQLLAWLVGGNPNVIFDETHFGAMESKGVASLIRKYHLEGFFIALFGLALLFVWKNATSLVPRQEEAAPESSSVSEKDMMAGLVNLLRSNISSRELIPVCFEEWKKSFAHLQKDDPEIFEKISEVIQAEEKRPSRERNPMKAYQNISQILTKIP